MLLDSYVNRFVLKMRRHRLALFLLLAAIRVGIIGGPKKPLDDDDALCKRAEGKNYPERAKEKELPKDGSETVKQLQSDSCHKKR